MEDKWRKRAWMGVKSLRAVERERERERDLERWRASTRLQATQSESIGVVLVLLIYLSLFFSRVNDVKRINRALEAPYDLPEASLEGVSGVVLSPPPLFFSNLWNKIANFHSPCFR